MTWQAYYQNGQGLGNKQNFYAAHQKRDANPLLFDDYPQVGECLLSRKTKKNPVGTEMPIADPLSHSIEILRIQIRNGHSVVNRYLGRNH